jgi:hypothetical protein
LDLAIATDDFVQIDFAALSCGVKGKGGIKVREGAINYAYTAEIVGGCEIWGRKGRDIEP